VALVAVLDADKEGFLRSERSLMQTCGRAARNVNGRVILYADTVTQSMRAAIKETQRRRQIQEEHNRKHGIVPKTVISEIKDAMNRHLKETGWDGYAKEAEAGMLKAAEPEQVYRSAAELRKEIEQLEARMREAAARLAFEEAAALRDRIKGLKLLELE
jgi:excinuclease ABC subunit B